MCGPLERVSCLILTVSLFEATVACAQYRVPTPTLTAFKPRGLRISIPDDAGLNLVIFYVSVNRDISGGDEAQYTEYVVTATDDEWVFDRNAVKVREGDIVYFKIYVQRYDRGYLHRGTPYYVAETLERPGSYQPPQRQEHNDCYIPPPARSSIHHHLHTTSTTPLPPPPTFPTTPEPRTTSSVDCSLSLNTVLQVLAESQKEVAQLKADLEVLRELAAKEPYRLHLSGLITETGEPKTVVEFVLFEKLNVRVSVKNAVKRGTTITFDLPTLDQKLDILKRAKKYLKDSPNILITT